jgi:hypothetical protein
MAIMLCCIVDGIIERAKEGTTAIAEKDITAIGYYLENPAELEDPDELNKAIEKYRHINTCYFSDCTIVPLRFGNIVQDKDEVRNFLNKTSFQIKTLIEKVKGKVEFVVQVNIDLDVAKETIAKHVGMSDRMAVGKAFFDLSEKHRVEIHEALKKELSPFVVDSVETSKINETQIVNNSYLLEKKKEELFDEAINTIAAVSDDVLAFHYIGPLPPYSFVPFQFNKCGFDLINSARLLLGLKSNCTPYDVKTNYKKLSREYHPDINFGGEEKFKEINEAYRIVMAYCSMEKTGECSFTKEAIESSFVNL